MALRLARLLPGWTGKLQATGVASRAVRWVEIGGAGASDYQFRGGFLSGIGQGVKKVFFCWQLND